MVRRNLESVLNKFRIDLLVDFMVKHKYKVILIVDGSFNIFPSRIFKSKFQDANICTSYSPYYYDNEIVENVG